MRVFQEEIFGPVVSVTKFADEAEALKIANDTLYGLGAGVWTRDGARAFRMGRGIEAGRVWTNCYHQYPAHAAFGGYKISGVGRENHRMMLDHYSQTKCLLVSYDENADGALLGARAERGSTMARIEATPAAVETIGRLREKHGPIVLHQSGGCCAGSAAMCLDARTSCRPAQATSNSA